MPQIFNLNFNRYEIYECGATLVSLLAYPDGEMDGSKRENLRRSLCALALRARYDETAAASSRPQLMKPIYALRDERLVEKDLKPLKRIMRQRMAAARMAIGFLQEVDMGTTPKLPDRMRNLSIAEASNLVLKDVGESDNRNVASRIWRPSLPVIHIAAATAVVKDMADKSDGEPLSIGHLIMTRPVINAIVKESQRYEPMLKKISKFNIDPKTLIALRTM